MMDRRAVRRAALSQRKTDVSLRFSVAAKTEAPRRVVSKKKKKKKNKERTRAAAWLLGCRFALGSFFSKASVRLSLMFGQEKKQKESSRYALQIVLTAVNRLCGAKAACPSKS